MKKREIITFSLIAAYIVIFVFLIMQERVRRNLDFFWSEEYLILILTVLAAGFGFILIKKFDSWKHYLKYPAFAILLPLALFPVVRCYFKIPYIFCKACPRKCPWGQVVRFTIPLFLTQNLSRRFWCFNVCPFGTIQDIQSKVCSKHIKLPKWAILIRYIFLAFTTFVVAAAFIGIKDMQEGALFRGAYHYSVIALVFALLIFIAAFFIPRFWCRYFCPVGAVGDIVLKAESYIKKKNK